MADCWTKTSISCALSNKPLKRTAADGRPQLNGKALTDPGAQVDSARNIGRAAALAAVVVWLTLESMTAAKAAAPAKKLVLTGTVTSIFQVEAPPPSRRNWGVTIRVEKVTIGKYAESDFTFAIHSPARAGLKVGHRYTVEATWDGKQYLVEETALMKEEPAKP